MKNILIITELFILIPSVFLLSVAFLLCGEVSLLKFLLIDIVLVLLIPFLTKKSNEDNKN